MNYDGFDWDAGNRDKCRKHGLSLGEIEDVFARPVLVLPDAGNSRTEPRFRAIGTSAYGRRVFVVFTVRAGAIRPISARYMHEREVANYEAAYPDLRDR